MLHSTQQSQHKITDYKSMRHHQSQELDSISSSDVCKTLQNCSMLI